MIAKFVYLFTIALVASTSLSQQVPSDLPTNIRCGVYSDAFLVSFPSVLFDGDLRLMTLNSYSNTTFAWATTCYQSQYLNYSNSSCAAAPTLAYERVDPSNLTYPVGEVYHDIVNGYEVHGVYYITDLGFLMNPDGDFVQIPDIDALVVDLVYNNTQLYNTTIFAGEIGLGPFSNIMNLNGSSSNQSNWLLTIGCLDSYSPQNCSVSNPVMYMGDGNYSQLWLGSANDSTCSEMREKSLTYPLEKPVQFGLYFDQYGNNTFSTELFELGNSGIQNGVVNQTVISTGIQGVGLNTYAYDQLLALIHNYDYSSEADSFVCKETYCLYENSCDYYQDTLLNLSFVIQFEGEQNIITVPLGAFAADDQTSHCRIFIQNMDMSPHGRPILVVGQTITFGTMFVAQYQAFFQNNQTNGMQKVCLTVNPESNLPNNYIGAPRPTQNDTSQENFQSLDYQNYGLINLKVNSTSMTATIEGMVGFQDFSQEQRFADFALGLSSSEILVFSFNCSNCESTTNMGQNYFYDAHYYSFGFEDVSESGYVYEATNRQASFCVNNFTNETQMLCASDTVSLRAVNQINFNSWNYGVPSASGSVGLSAQSAFWGLYERMCSEPNLVKGYSIMIGNLTDWSFAQPSYINTQPQYNMMMCSNGYPLSNQYISLNATTSPQINFFGFGLYANNQSQFNDLDSDTIKGTVFSMDFRGLGLPTPVRQRFVDYLSIITRGESSCDLSAGICILSRPCANYDIWEYGFRVQFDNNTNGLIVPLATFASDSRYLGEDVCNIYVQTSITVDGQEETDDQLIFGLMFFQSFSFTQYVDGNSDELNVISLSLNTQALDTAAMIDIDSVPNQQLNFEGQPDYIRSSLTNQDYYDLPVFNATFAGDSVGGQFYYIDLNSADSMVFDINCYQYLGNGMYQICGAAPVFANDLFNAVENTKLVSEYENFKGNGFNTTSNIYEGQICFGNHCKISQFYSAYYVDEDTQLYNQYASYGVIGLGMYSPVWDAYVDTNQTTAVYSVSLSRDFQVSNITLGGTDQSYIEETHVKFDAEITDHQQLYSTFNFTFGSVQNGTEYFESLMGNYTQYDTIYSISYAGIGLPYTMYQQYVSLLQTMNSNFQCDSFNGACYIQNYTCSQLEEVIGDLYFQSFQSKDRDYIRIPLMLFSHGYQTCYISVQQSNLQYASDDLIILGGAFFSGFYGEFYNHYDFRSQSAYIFVNQETQYNCYVGNEELPIGPSPFDPVPVVKNMPLKFPAFINPQSLLIETQVEVEGQTTKNFTLDNNANITLAWQTGCIQHLGANNLTNKSCHSEPTFVQDQTSEIVNSSNSYDYKNQYNGGYLTNGASDYWYLNFTALNGTCYGSKQTVINTVQEIIETNWIYNITDQPAGILGLYGQGLQFSYLVELGQVANQSFAGRPFVPSNASLYAGPGNYSDILSDQQSKEPALTFGQQGEQYLSAFALGAMQITNQSDYFGNYTIIGNPNLYHNAEVPTSAIFQLNFQGLGLPHYYFQQVVSLLQRSEAFNSSIQCSSEKPSKCRLPQPCSAYEWNLAFQMNFYYSYYLNTDGPYIYVPLATFAVDNQHDGNCEIMIQDLGEDSQGNDPIILGSMFLQNFILYTEWQEDYYGQKFTNTTLMLSSSSALPGTHIGASLPNGYESSFDSPPYPIVLNVTIDETLTPTIRANVDFQGTSDFKFSLSSGVNFMYGIDCRAYSGSCHDTYSTIDYFDSRDYIAQYPYYGETYAAGMYGAYEMIKGIFCVEDQSHMLVCSEDSISQAVVQTIYKEDWSLNQNQGAGQIGLSGQNQAIRALVSQYNRGYQGYSLQMSNFTDGQFAQPGYQPKSTQSKLILEHVLYLNTTTVQMYSYNQADYSSISGIDTSEFGFGITYVNNTGNNTEYYQSLLFEQIALGPYSYALPNQTIMSTDVSGLLLPYQSYDEFWQLLSIAAQESVDCRTGACYLQRSCLDYPSLWQYSFKVMFNGTDGTYFKFPLATIAKDESNSTANGTEISRCKIFVQEQSPYTREYYQVVLGAMFFGQVAVSALETPSYYDYSEYYVDYSFWVNENAFNATTISSDYVAPGPDPFVSRPINQTLSLY